MIVDIINSIVPVLLFFCVNYLIKNFPEFFFFFFLAIPKLQFGRDLIPHFHEIVTCQRRLSIASHNYPGSWSRFKRPVWHIRILGFRDACNTRATKWGIGICALGAWEGIIQRYIPQSCISDACPLIWDSYSDSIPCLRTTHISSDRNPAAVLNTSLNHDPIEVEDIIVSIVVGVSILTFLIC